MTGEYWYDTGVKVTEKFTYLQIPVLLKVKLMKEGKFIPVVFAGPSLSFLLSTKEAGESFKEFFHSTDFGLDFGLGGEMTLGNMKGLLDLRYYLGLTNAYNPQVVVLTIEPGEINLKNRALSLTVGPLF